MRQLTLLGLLPLALAACADQEEPFAIRCTGESKGTVPPGDGIETKVVSETWTIDPKTKTLTQIGSDGRTGKSFCAPSRRGTSRCEVRVSSAAVEADRTHRERYSNGHKMRIDWQFRYDRDTKTAFAAQYITSTATRGSHRVRQLACSPTPLPILETSS
jgi:hypothetical protein